MKEWFAQIAVAMAPRERMLDAAARCVMDLGYQPSDCLIQQLRGPSIVDLDTVEVDRLLVLGEPCFEVTVRRTPMKDWTFTITTTPRLIAWPPAREGTPPGTSPPLMNGS